MAEIIKITDLSCPQLDVYNLRSEVQLLHYYEPDEGIFIAESPKVIKRAIDAGYKPISVLVESSHIENENAEVSDILNDIENAPVYMAEFDVLTKLTGYKLTNGMLACMRRKPLPSVADICTGATRIAILEDVVNPTNLGAIFRNAAALNIDAVLLTPACADPLYRRAARVSMGTVFNIPWTISEKVYNLVKSLGFKTAAMALTNCSISVRDMAPRSEEKLAIFLGNEGNGLKPETISMCDYTIKIPMREGIDSLNVAAASAVAFFELC